MNLSNDLVNKFVEITNDETPNKEGSTAYGVTVQYGDRMYVKLDGSDLLTPVETTSAIKSGERVTVLIKDHNATVTGNLSDPSASSKDLTDVGDKIAEVDILIADKVDTKILVAETARIEELIATKASIGQLEADRAEIEHLMANKAEITDLEAINADIEILDAEVADIETLVNGHLTSDNIQSLVLTSDKVTVDNAFIKDAMIDNISANKITSGQINTSLVSISSEDGSMTLNGSTQQFKDSEGTVRIQIGKDTEGNFTFCLFSQDGVGILLDEEGIHAGAVPDGLIVNDMVADNANISGGKLDINSVITSINNGTTTIDSSRIYLDEESQSLKVAFDSLKTKVETIEETSVNGDLSSVIEQITNNTTNINVMQGQISSLISNTTITKENGEVVQLKDEYNSTKDTVDSHTTKIGSLETTVNSVSSKQASMELDLNGFRTEVSDNYVTKEELDLTGYNLINNGKFENCYAGTYDMIPSWICDDGLQLWNLRAGKGEGWAFLNESTTPGDMRGIRQNINLEKDTVYTLSFKASWQENVNQGIEGYFYFYDSNWNTVAILTIPITNNDLNFDDIQTFTFLTLANFEYCEIKFYFGETIGSNGQYISASVHEVKLEEGDTYTGWRGSKKDEGAIIEGPNLIQNGDFSSYTLPKTIDGWWINGDGYIYEKTGQDGYNKEGCIYFAHTSDEDVYSGFTQEIRNLKKRTEYTLTFYINWETNVRSFYVDLLFYDLNGNRLFTIDLKPSHQGIWSYTFVTPDIDFQRMNVGFCHRGRVSAAGGYLGIAGNVKLVEKVVVDDIRNLLSNYTTKTELQQTNEDFTFKISQAGGYNLIRNSTGDGGLKGWTCNTDKSTYYMFNIEEPNPKISPNGYAFGYINLSTTTEKYSYSPRFTLKPNTTYTLSAWIQTQKNVASLDIFILGSENLQGTESNNTSYASKHIYHIICTDTGGAWQYVTQTFTTKDGIKSGFIRVDHNGLKMETDSYVNIYWTSLMLTEGSIALPWSPHPSEIYDGIVKIDKNGLTVQHGSDSTVMDSNSFKIKVGSETHAQIKDGLFTFTDGSGSNILGRIGRNFWEGTNVGMTSLGASYGNTISLSAQWTSGGNYITGAVCSTHDKWIADNYFYRGININTPVIAGRTIFRDVNTADRTQWYGETRVGMMDMWASDDSSMGWGGMIIGNNYFRTGIYAGGSVKSGFVLREDSAQSNSVAIHGYGPINMHGYSITNSSSTMSLNPQSRYTKSLLSEGTNEHISYGTLSYSDNEIRWCWKENVFTYQDCDVDPVTDEWVYLDRYICYIELPIFMAENIEADYHINVSKMSWGDWRIREKNQYYFILESQEEDFAFTFEVVAKLKDGATITNNAIVANNSIDTEASVSVPQDIEGTVDPVGSINIQENINTGEES